MRRVFTFGILSIAFVLTMGALAGRSQQNATPLDKEFLIKAVSCNNADLKASEIAEKSASNNKVREFARNMVKQHTSVTESLSQIGKSEQIAILTGMEKETKQLLDRLSKLSGTELDREYLKAMIDSHERAIQLYEGQVKNGKSASITDFATKTLPALRDHLKEAKLLSTTINAK